MWDLWDVFMPCLNTVCFRVSRGQAAAFLQLAVAHTCCVSMSAGVSCPYRLPCFATVTLRMLLDCSCCNGCADALRCCKLSSAFMLL